MHHQYEIALADTGEAADLAGLRASWVADTDVEPSADFVADFRSWMEREADHRLFWIARTAPHKANAIGEAVGMVNLSLFDRMPSPGRMPSRWGYLGNMYVRAAHRNAGLGARLLDTVLDYVDANQLVHVMLNPTAQAKPFYGRAGFDREHDVLRRLRPPEQ